MQTKQQGEGCAVTQRSHIDGHSHLLNATWRYLLVGSLAAALTACGGGGGANNDKPGDATVTSTVTPQAVLSTQQSFEALNTTGGQFDLSWNFPFEDTSRTGTVNFIYASSYSLMTASPSTGAQTQTGSSHMLNGVMIQLGSASVGPRRFLIDGKVWLDSFKRTVSYVGDGVNIDYVGHDAGSASATVLSQHISKITVTPLSDAMRQSPAELLAALPIQNWVGFGIFQSDAAWATGSAYVKTQTTLVRDTIFVQDCSHTTVTVTTGTAPTPCVTGSDLDHFFPIVLKSGSKPFENNVASDGTIQSNINGVRMWIANQPLPLAQALSTAYRVYFELNGNVYQGLLQKDGSALLDHQADGSAVNYHVSLNSQALASVTNGLIPTAMGTGTEQANIAALDTVDLYGIGGSGINGGLTPADLRKHYNIPDSLTGDGQTIVIVDGPGLGDVQSDLNTFSQTYGLPACTQDNGCFTRIDLSNSTTKPVQAWGTEVALDVEMVHAIAPKAHIILVTAASSSDADLLAAINQAGHKAGVTAVSMSFGISGATNATGRMAQDAKFVSYEASRGTIFFASTGDSAYFPAGFASYPAESPYVTAVGGTRITSAASVGSDQAWTYSGGGLSTYATVPDDWLAYAASDNLGCTAINAGKRVFPDVAALADAQHSNFAVYHRGRWTTGGGTSASAPLWAGVSALLAESLSKQGLSLAELVKNAPTGFNSLLYQIRRNQLAQAGGGFHDVLWGSNNLGLGAGGCMAQAGYSGLTGWGTPDVALLASNFSSLALK